MKTQPLCQQSTSDKSDKILIKRCHCCGQLMESTKEIDRCPHCKKTFLPANYFHKVHAKNTAEFKNLFCDACELTENDLIKGLQVLW